MTNTLHTSSPDQISRIERAKSWLPHLRELEDLKRILADEPIYPNVGDRLSEIEDEIRSIKTQIINALEPIN